MANSLAIRDGSARPDQHPHVEGALGALALGALGVVYGDIGTSPLYTLKTAYDWAGSTAPDVALGLLSLIIWTLVITTSVKYVALVMRADNHGEGGILALMARVGIRDSAGRIRPGVVWLGIVGAALLYGDGAITPAISVLSALEGLKLPMPALAPYVLPLAASVLLCLFLLQHKGTAVIGRLFGPIMLVWFVTIGVLGVIAVFQHPSVLMAVNPRYGIDYLTSHGFRGFTVLGAVFLSATGAEALYADMGHFGAPAIRIGWYGLVLPCLLLNYAGQTALVMQGKVSGDANPFFLLGATWVQLPMVVLATVATIIASQSIISGVFSMTRQAVQLGLSPRLHITQTSAEGYGQIYVSSINWLLMIFTLGLTLGFGSSDRLAAAFGIAVSMTMLLTTLLMYRMMREQWHWGIAVALAIAGALGLVDGSFVAANLTKVLDGGWVPLIAAAAVCTLMGTWGTGKVALLHQVERDTMPLGLFIAASAEIQRVPGTAVFLSRRLDVVPLAMLHSLKHYNVLHQRNVILHIETEQVPRVPNHERLYVTPLGERFYRIVLRYGFMEHPNVPAAFDNCALAGEGFDLMSTTFFFSHETVCAGEKKGALNPIIRRLFIWMHRNAYDATDFFRIPRNRIVELGARIEL
ncbi:MAG: KUP/HAK/KT family potassium transporter [Burkholderiaceae bacterium]|nr:KUP/HAK/KT family potassium transporter [Burkholderiaceae bacterium]